MTIPCTRCEASKPAPFAPCPVCGARPASPFDEPPEPLDRGLPPPSAGFLLGLGLLCLVVTPLPALALAWAWRREAPRSALRALAVALGCGALGLLAWMGFGVLRA
jgi:hypothetical protein